MEPKTRHFSANSSKFLMPLFSDRGLQCVAPAEIIGLECFSPCRFGAIVAASLITSCLARDWQDDVRSISRLPRSRCSAFSIHHASGGNAGRLCSQRRANVKVIIFGAGVQGTVYGVRLARAGHEVTLVATPRRAVELRRFGATIRNAETSEAISADVAICEELPPDCKADLCLVTVRREQLDNALISVTRATEIERFVFLVNHANGSEDIFEALGRPRTVLAFPGIAGTYQEDAVGYIDVSQQHTVVEASAAKVVDLFRGAGFLVDWLKRHAVFITSIAGALYEKDCSPTQLAKDHGAVRRFILAVRGGWLELDRRDVDSAPWTLKFIFCQAPLWFSVRYWAKLLSSARGELYFAAHARHAPAEMAALASDVRSFIPGGKPPELARLLNAIQRWQEH